MEMLPLLTYTFSKACKHTILPMVPDFTNSTASKGRKAPIASMAFSLHLRSSGVRGGKVRFSASKSEPIFGVKI